MNPCPIAGARARSLRFPRLKPNHPTRNDLDGPRGADILGLTYVGVAVGRFPGLRLDRAGIALLGGAAMIAIGALSMDDAYRAINFDTIILLFGMMIVIANLQLSGFFSLVAGRVVEHANRPVLLLIAIVLISGVFSAFFVNDTMCLVLTPLVLEITGTLRRNPVPYLLAVAMAANIGSVATITGNPQNMMTRGDRQRGATRGAGGSGADVEINLGGAGDDHHVLRRLARAEGRDCGRRRASDYAPRAARQGL